jgi:hypothetical protein
MEQRQPGDEDDDRRAPSPFHMEIVIIMPHALLRILQWSAFIAFSARNHPGSTIPFASGIRSAALTSNVWAA